MFLAARNNLSGNNNSSNNLCNPAQVHARALLPFEYENCAVRASSKLNVFRETNVGGISCCPQFVNSRRHFNSPESVLLLKWNVRNDPAHSQIRTVNV